MSRPLPDAGEPGVAARARHLLASDAADAEPLPSTERFARRQPRARRAALARWRVELYAIASVIANATALRARRERPSYPPYGLVRSLYTQMRMVTSSPKPYPAGSLTGFHALGAALLDTVVFHLDAEMEQARRSERAWLLSRLEHLLSLYRLDAAASLQARIRDGFSFLYGGLHFGTTVSVQMVETMAALLEGDAELDGDARLEGEDGQLSGSERAAVLQRSVRAGYQLAGLNIDHLLVAYQSLQAPAGASPAGTLGRHMDRDRFYLVRSAGRPWRIDLGDREALVPPARPPRYSTLGCPARVSPTGGPSAIAVLWSWCVELAEDAGLLGGAA